MVFRTAGRSSSPRSSSLVTQSDVQAVEVGGRLILPEGALITPLARQAALERRIDLVAEDEAPEVEGVADAGNARSVAIGADHGGFQLKEELKNHLHGMHYAVLDCGTDSSEAVDYPDLAFAVARLVSQGRAAFGIVVDGAGIGSCMVANKVPGVRAALPCTRVPSAAARTERRVRDNRSRRAWPPSPEPYGSRRDRHRIQSPGRRRAGRRGSARAWS